MKKKQSGFTAFLAVIAVVIVIAVISNDGGNKTESQPPTAPIASQTASTPRTSPSSTMTESTPTRSSEDALGGSIGERVEAWVAAQDFVRQQLVSPSTAKFHGVAQSPYVVYLGNARYKVTATVDSQNVFGAMIRTNFAAVVRAKRDEHQTWVLESLEL